MKKDNDIFYSLSVEDIQRVANEELNRALSGQEIQSVKDEICESIDWYGIIANVLNIRFGSENYEDDLLVND
jgi:hypothetical protein